MKVVTFGELMVRLHPQTAFFIGEARSGRAGLSFFLFMLDKCLSLC